VRPRPLNPPNLLKTVYHITGICFGHQIVARALGGECVLNSGWEVAITEVILTDLGQRIFGVPSIVRWRFASSCYISNAVAEHPTNAPRPCTHCPPILSSAWVDDQNREPGYGAALRPGCTYPDSK